MAAGMDDPGEHRLVVVPDEWVSGDLASRYVASLPSAAGTFTGTYDADVIEQFFGPPPLLVPVEVDTNDKPNPLAGLPRGAVFSFSVAGRRWSFTIDHVSQGYGNRWTAWCYRDSIQEVTVTVSDA